MGEPVGKVVVILGTRSDGTLRTVELTDADAIKVAFAAAAQGLVGIHGWVDSAWQKQPLAFGYSDVLEDLVSDTSLASGSDILNSTTCPAGEIWIVTTVAMAYAGTPPTYIEMQYAPDVTWITIMQEGYPLSGQWYDRQGWFVIEEGGGVRVAVTGATLNDDLYLRIGGFKVDIDQ